MKNLSIIGSTGSIGTQALNVVRRNRDKFNIKALMANNNLDLLDAQVKEFRPLYVGVFDEKLYCKAKDLFNDCEVLCGYEALAALAALDCIDTALISVVGMEGLYSVESALKAGKQVALANKEALVAGGEIVMNLAKENGVSILPIDSEHSAVWQCLASGKKSDLKKIILTASGGPFYGKSRGELRNITPQMAIAHPTWKMGKKISVDSATMMNKGLEIIEAKWLFDCRCIEYIIHRESIIHSMVQFQDGSTIAQLSFPSMEIPISLALSYPDRLSCDDSVFDFSKPLTFSAPDELNFPLPMVAVAALDKGGNCPCIINAANEAAVELFLNEKIAFTDIFNIVENSLNDNFIKTPKLEDIFATYHNTKEKLMTDYNKNKRTV